MAIDYVLADQHFQENSVDIEIKKLLKLIMGGTKINIDGFNNGIKLISSASMDIFL